jgi:hypothetical protein
MDKLDSQLATIIQDIKSPTLDGLRAATVADGFGDVIAGSISLALFVIIVVSIARVSESDKKFLWFKGPFDKDDINMFRVMGAILGLVTIMIALMGLASPSTWLKITYPDAIIAQRVLTNR